MTEQIEPCPNPECGGECDVFTCGNSMDYKEVACVEGARRGCGYVGPEGKDEESALALHNRIARAVREAGELRQENKRLTDALSFVERWACHHGNKMRNGEPLHSAEEILGVIQHYPTVKEITKSYADGVVPDTPDPFERAEKAEAERDALRALIERHNERIDKRCGPPGPGACCGKNPSRHTECGDCPRRYIIELPKEQG